MSKRSHKVYLSALTVKIKRRDGTCKSRLDTPISSRSSVCVCTRTHGLQGLIEYYLRLAWKIEFMEAYWCLCLLLHLIYYTIIFPACQCQSRYNFSQYYVVRFVQYIHHIIRMCLTMRQFLSTLFLLFE